LKQYSTYGKHELSTILTNNMQKVAFERLYHIHKSSAQLMQKDAQA
jgi:hypothetical protein